MSRNFNFDRLTVWLPSSARSSVEDDIITVKPFSDDDKVAGNVVKKVVQEKLQQFE